MCHPYINRHPEVATAEAPNTDEKRQRKDQATWELIGRENSARKQQFNTFNQDENINRICKDDSALHSISLFEAAIPARREKAHDNIQQEKRPASSILPVTDIKEEEQDRDELQLFGFDHQKETRKTEETRVKTHNQSTVLPNCQVYQDTASVCQLGHSTPNTLEQRNPEGQDAESPLQKKYWQHRTRML